MCAVKIGWAKRDISTTEPVNINGQMYLRMNEGIHDPISVTALVIDGGEGQDAAIFVSCDLTSIVEEVKVLSREKVAAKDPQIPVKNIVLNATHTHSSSATFKTAEKSPDGKDIYPGEKYREFATDQIADAVCEAWKTRKEGGIAYGYGYAVVGHSRRVIYSEDQGGADANAAPNGFGVMYGSTKKPAFSHYEAGADHFLNVMFTVDANKKLTGMIINVPCPSQLSEHFTKLSADYWCEVREAVAAEYGEDVFVLAQCAAAGDLSPRILHYGKAQSRRMELKYGLGYETKGMVRNGAEEYKKVMGERKDIAERIMNGVRDIYGWAMKDIQTDVTVRHVGEVVWLPRRNITEAEYEECQANLKKLEESLPDPETMSAEEYRVAMSRNASFTNRNKTAIKRYGFLKTDPALDYEIHVTQIGEIAFASNPFELYQDFMHRIQARSPFIQTFITQLAGDGGACYVPTKRGEFNKGYSASIFCNAVGSEGGQTLVEYTLKVLNEMKAKDE